jgi:hypothetical protein
MTPERLDEIIDQWRADGGSYINLRDIADMAKEIRRLWAVLEAARDCLEIIDSGHLLRAADMAELREHVTAYEQEEGR